MSKSEQAIEITRGLLSSETFKSTHRTEPKYFTRDRKLTFPVVTQMIMRKSVKSIQVQLNELYLDSVLPVVSGSAYTMARSHLKAEAFLELHKKAVLEVMYQDGNYKTFAGMRVIAIDGSRVYLPCEEAIINHFGGTVENQYSDIIYPYGLLSQAYDVLNKITLDVSLQPAKSYEVDIVLDQHLSCCEENDLLLMDRNYPSYICLASLTVGKPQFVIRCSQSSFKAARRMFKGHGPDSQIVTLTCPKRHLEEIREKDLPKKIKVRLVRVTLDTGEIEVLITSLLDETEYPTEIFGHVYNLRWAVETDYDCTKNRLNLENFSGKTVHSVFQDLYSTIFVSGLESILIEQANEQLADKSQTNQFPLQVNHAISFNAIKNQVFQLFDTQTDTQILLDRLTQIFLTKPTAVRKERITPRTKPTASKRLKYYKRRCKICF